MEKRYAAGGIVIREIKNDVEVLIIKDIYGRWTWPKGHAEEGESPEETALREISEETGLKDIEILEVIGRQEYFYNIDGSKVEKIVDIFLVRSRGDGQLKGQPGEVQDISWLPSGEVAGKMEYDGADALMEKGLRVFYEKYRKHS